MSNEFPIKIVTTAERAGAQTTQADLQAIQAASKETAKTAVAAEQEVQTATKETFTSKQQLKGAVKGLAAEFPALASVARLALNPVTLIVTGIVSAFSLWKKRLDELTVSLGGIEMPDVSETEIDRINRTADAWGRLAEKTGAFSARVTALKKDAAEVIKLIEFNDSFQRALGIDTGTDATKSKAEILAIEAANLEAEGRAKIAGAGTPGSKEAEAALGKTFAEAAAAAAVELKAAQERLAELLAFRAGEMPVWQQPLFGAQFGIRYGPTTTGGDAIALERQKIADQQGIIDRFGRFATGTGDRAGRRAQIAAGEGMVEEAGRLRSEVTDLLRAAMIAATADASKRIGQASAGGDIAGAAKATMDIGAQFAILGEMLQQVRNENAVILQRLNFTATR